MLQKLKFFLLLVFIVLAQAACIATQAPIIDHNSAIYNVAVAPGVSYEDVIDSLKINAQGMNFVNSASFAIGEQLKLRELVHEEPLEVHAFCNLALGAEIMQDHPEFVVFAPCRIAIYQKKGQLYLALARPTFDLKSIKNPSARAVKAAQALENALIRLIQKSSKGDF
ncbi:MAG: DUF302 domain-containing protein [Methylophilaceae bacterium]